MECEIAKHNPLMIELATRHYLTQGKSTPIYRFMSLYRDDEPYPLAELMIAIKQREQALSQVLREYGREADLLALNVCRSRINKLNRITG